MAIWLQAVCALEVQFFIPGEQKLVCWSSKNEWFTFKSGIGVLSSEHIFVENAPQQQRDGRGVCLCVFSCPNANKSTSRPDVARAILKKLKSRTRASKFAQVESKRRRAACVCPNWAEFLRRDELRNGCEESGGDPSFYGSRRSLFHFTRSRLRRTAGQSETHLREENCYLRLCFIAVKMRC